MHVRPINIDYVACNEQEDRRAWVKKGSNALPAPMEKIKVMILVEDIDDATGALILDRGDAGTRTIAAGDVYFGSGAG